MCLHPLVLLLVGNPFLPVFLVALLILDFQKSSVCPRYLSETWMLAVDDAA